MTNKVYEFSFQHLKEGEYSDTDSSLELFENIQLFELEQQNEIRRQRKILQIKRKIQI